MFSSVELWFDSSDSEDSEEENKKKLEKLKIKRRIIRDRSNPLELPDNVFVKFFRIPKEAFLYLLNILESKIKPPVGSSSVSALIKLVATLRFYAEGSYQKCIGDDFCVGVQQSTFSKILSQVTSIIEDNVVAEMIKFPNDNEKDNIKKAFHEKFKFPGIIGCVDSTHIKIISPSKDKKHLYYNKKGFCSMKVMLVCDHEMRITFVDATNPGASHDAFVWNKSRINELMLSNYNSGERNSWFLGDAEYPLRPYLMTPFRMHSNMPDNSRESKFNQIHSKARDIIERTIRTLKNTFRCLMGAKEMHYKPEKVTKIINACCALHNLRIKYKTPYEEAEEEIPGTINDEDENNFQEYDNTEDAIKIRESIMNSLL